LGCKELLTRYFYQVLPKFKRILSNITIPEYLIEVKDLIAKNLIRIRRIYAIIIIAIQIKGSSSPKEPLRL
jgi:hypothetical protein